MRHSFLRCGDSSWDWKIMSLYRLNSMVPHQPCIDKYGSNVCNLPRFEHTAADRQRRHYKGELTQEAEQKEQMNTQLMQEKEQQAMQLRQSELLLIGLVCVCCL